MSTDSGNEAGRSDEKTGDPPNLPISSATNEKKTEPNKLINNFSKIDQYIEENSLETDDSTPIYLYHRNKGTF